MSVTRRVLLRYAVVTLAVGATGCTRVGAGPTEITLSVTRKGPPAPETVEVALGSVVTLTVESEIDDVLHVHGYEIETDLRPGSRETVRFEANMSGAFEVETHSNSAIWMKLVVQ